MKFNNILNKSINAFSNNLKLITTRLAGHNYDMNNYVSPHEFIINNFIRDFINKIILQNSIL